MSTPAAEQPQPQAINISLTDLHQRYTAAVQRLFDISAFTLGAVRTQTEKDYDAFARSAGYLPDGRTHAKYDAIRPIGELWLLRQLVADGLNMLIPLLEDCRSIAALALWKSTEEANQAKAQAILTTERQEFLKLGIGEKLKHLRDTFGVNSQLEVLLPGLYQLDSMLKQTGGKVPKEFLGSTGEWVLHLAAITVEKGTDGQQTGKLGRIERRFPLGANVVLAKEDVLLLVGSIGFYVTTLIGSLQEYVKKTTPVVEQPA